MIDDRWYLVDLPGYGFAKVSKDRKEKWEQMISSYLTSRSNLCGVFVLIDSRLEPQTIDLEFVNWCGEQNVPFVLAFTKADKQSGVKSDQNIAKFRRAMKKWFEEIPTHFLTSSETKLGCELVLENIDAINQQFESPIE